MNIIQNYVHVGIKSSARIKNINTIPLSDNINR